MQSGVGDEGGRVNISLPLQFFKHKGADWGGEGNKSGLNSLNLRYLWYFQVEKLSIHLKSMNLELRRKV